MGVTYFLVVNIKTVMADIRENKFGRCYKKGKPVSEELRTKILKLHSRGDSYGQISKETGVTKSACHKIVQTFVGKSSLEPRVRTTPPASKLTVNVLQFIEYEKKKKPSIYCREIRDKLLERNVCTRDNVPSVTYIQKAINNHLGMSYKRLQKVPQETIRDGHYELVNRFLAEIIQYKPEQIHFF